MPYLAVYGLLTNDDYSCVPDAPYDIGVMKGYKLAAYNHLTVEQCSGAEVQVCILHISLDDILNHFDRYEGFPDYYNRIVAPVNLGSMTVMADVYVMNDEYKNGLPSLCYIEQCYDGYKQKGMKMSQLDEVFILTKGSV